MKTRSGFAVALLASQLIGASVAAEVAVPKWRELPPTPSLPQAVASGYASVNGIKLYYSVFGQGAPVILLHGGLSNSSYWGFQVPQLSKYYEVITIDSRGHGRSTRTDQPFSYELMASDVIGLMDQLKIAKAAVVGWSDGAIIGLELAIHNPDRLTGVFAFAANYNPSGVREDLDQNPTFNGFIERASKEYEKLSSTPTQYKEFLAAVTKMWSTEPNLTQTELRNIKVPIIIADGDHDEAIKREQTEEMAALIPDAGLLIQPGVSHFSMLQDPDQFAMDVLHFLAQINTR
jgi:pimeloyl-ACP methyl ester carboxylesterase